MRIAGVDPAIVADYAEAMESGAVFPPVVVFHDGGEEYWLADGFHRAEAAKRIGREEITAEVRLGSQRDAVLHAVGANASHGLRRTPDDRRRAIETLLRDPAWAKWSDREIGKACAVDHKTVGKVRRALTGDVPTDRTVSYRDRHGNVSEMKVAAPAATTMTERMLAKVSTEALLVECRRRGLEVIT
jgi:ParB-like chromosome segregation protein Spo0J